MRTIRIIDRYTRRPNMREMAAEYKSRGLGKWRAWDQYIIDNGLKPDVDAKMFYAAYNAVDPAPLSQTRGVTIQFNPTHLDTLTHEYCEIVKGDDDVFYIVWESGHTGSQPPIDPPSPERFLQI